MSGEKLGSISPDWDTADIKMCAKKYGCSFNDIIMAMISVSLHRYFIKRNEPQNQVRMGLPASFRKVPKTAEALELNNDIALFFIDLALHPEIEDGLKSVQTEIRKFRTNFKPFAVYYMVKFFIKVPLIIYLWLSDIATTKISITLSNVAGPKTPLIYDGVKCGKIVFFLPFIGKYTCGLSIISVTNKVKAGFITDKTIMDDPDEFMEIFDQVK